MRRFGNISSPLVGVVLAAVVLMAAVTAWPTNGETDAGQRPSATGDAAARQGVAGSREGVASPPAGDVHGSRAKDPSGAARVFVIYLAADGSDVNSGLHPGEAIRTLRRAQRVLQAARPGVDVEVRIAPGTYVAPPTHWTFLVPGHTVSFMPADFQVGGDLADAAGRPVFRGDGTSGFWLTATLPRGHTGDAGLRFYFLRVEHYDRGGLMISGGTTVVGGRRRPIGGGHNGNRVVGMYFTELGSRWAGKGHGFGGLDLVNSRDNDILFNHFVKLENSGSEAGLIHGIYLAHSSNANRVRDNTFKVISGDPVRTRNASNDNDISDNVLRRTGLGAQYSDWFCSRRCAKANDQAAECASHGNLFHDNTTASGYRERVPDWTVLPISLQHKGCKDDAARRVRTWDNR